MSFHTYNAAGEMREAAPTRCPAGHDLGPDRVLVGALPCLCPPGLVKSHRTWRCVECDLCWARPACTERPDLVPWEPGLDARA